MNELTDYLYALKTRLEIKSINQFSIRLGIPQSTMDVIMKGKLIPGDEICVKIANLSEDRPEFVIALAHKSKAKGEIKNHWDKIIKAITAATFLILFTLSSSAIIAKKSLNNPSLYIMSNH